MATYHTETPDAVYISSTRHVTTAVEIQRIRDWLPWSIANVFIGWGAAGLLPLIFTILCRNEKRNNDINNARAMSTLALVFNIVITLIGIAGWICLIILLVNVRHMYTFYYPKY